MPCVGGRAGREQALSFGKARRSPAGSAGSAAGYGGFVMSTPKTATTTEAIIEGIIGEVMLCALPRPPKNWLPCDGAVLDIEKNKILFMVLGNRFGGNGKDNFMLPDLRSQVPLHYQTEIGAKQASSELDQPALRLTTGNLPSHTHNARFTGESQNVKVRRNLLVTDKIGQVEPQAGGFLGKGGSGSNSAPIFLPATDQTQESVALKGFSTKFQVAVRGDVTVKSFGKDKPDSVIIPHVKMMWCICAIGDYLIS